MAFARPTFSQLYDQALSDIKSVSGASALLRRAVLPAVAFALAGLAWLNYSYLDYISRESVPFTAKDEYLYAWGAMKGVNPKPAETATGSVQFSGSNGAVVASGSSVARSDGAAYVTTADSAVAAGLVTVPVVALVAGSAGNTDALIGFTLSSPVPGVSAGGLASTAISGGADAEPVDDYKTRMLAVYAQPPQGGSASDYVEWATAVPGVTRAWVNPNGAGAGTVVVYTMWDNAEAAHGGFPQGADGVASLEARDTSATGDQLVVANYIYPLRPVTALVYSVAPPAYEVDFTIADLEPSTVAIQSAISVALTAVFLRSAAPYGTSWPLAVVDAPNGVMYPSEFSAAISAVPGIRRFTLASPSAKITATPGAIPTLGTITYV